MLSIYLEDVELSDGLDMQLALNQAIYRERFSDVEEFHHSLVQAAMLQECRAAVKEEDTNSVQSDNCSVSTAVSEKEKVDSADGTTKKIEKTRKKGRRGGRLLGCIGFFLEMLYGIYIGPEVIGRLTEPGIYRNGGQLFGMMLLPHIVIALVFLGAFLILGKSDNAAMVTLFTMMLSTLTAVVIGAFRIQLDVGGLARALISLGVNLVPALVTSFIYFFCVGVGAEQNKE